jgi:hypothetical protein
MRYAIDLPTLSRNRGILAADVPKSADAP